MQTGRIVQAVVLMMIVAIGASCAATKAYTSKLFAPRDAATSDSQAVAALRFLDLGDEEKDTVNWVTTDIIMGRDTMSRTAALDKLATVFPANPVSNETKPVENDTKPVLVQTKKVEAPVESVTTDKKALAKNKKADKKKNTETVKKEEPVPATVTSEPEESEPVARTANPGEVRNKKSRED